MALKFNKCSYTSFVFCLITRKLSVSTDRKDMEKSWAQLIENGETGRVEDHDVTITGDG
jgi:hypothetical protein